MTTRIMSSPSKSAVESPSVTHNGPSSLTPVRHNYAATHTPIASAKRPRQPLNANRTLSSSDGLSPNSTPSVLKPMQLQNYTPSSVSRQQEQQMSPMHPPRPVPVGAHGAGQSRANVVSSSPETTSPESLNSNSSSSFGNSSWVGRKVDAIFSPVLNFLNGKNHQHNSFTKLPDCDIQMNDPQTNSMNPLPKDESVDMIDPNSVANDALMKCTLAHENNVQIDNSCDTAERYSPEKLNVEYLDSSLSDGSISLDIESSSEIEDTNDHEDEFNPYLFIKTLPSYSLVVSNPCEKICLPPKAMTDPPISLVLDLDETLVHCTVEPIHDADMVFPVTFHGTEYTVYVRLRPYLKEFFEAIHGKFEVVIFTASQQAYADELLNRIDPQRKYIHHRLFRESCLFVEGNYLKDLNVLGRNLGSCVLVDNSPHAFGYQVDNGIPIESWFDDLHDTELLKLEKFLNTLHGVDDVRTVVRSKFQTYKLIRDA